MIEDNAGSSKRVRGDDDLLVELEARGYTHAAVGKAAGVSERTVQRRAAEPAFVARVTSRRKELFADSMQRMVGLSEKAHAVIEEALEGDRGFEAARFVLSMLPRLHQLVGVDEELRVLREQLQELRQSIQGGSR
jgi:hypothetical protein